MREPVGIRDCDECGRTYQLAPLWGEEWVCDTCDPGREDRLAVAEHREDLAGWFAVVTAVVLLVWLVASALGCALIRHPSLAVVIERADAFECCDATCAFSSSIGCPVGPVPPRKGRRS